MQKGNLKVEQVDRNGNIIEEQDISLSKKEIFMRMKKFFPGLKENTNNFYEGNYNGNEYLIRVKNVTYLGTPHPTFKKRIQIPNDLPEFYGQANLTRKKPLLMGIYTFRDNILFCDFNIEDFIDKKANNSSAHIYVSDLEAAVEEGIFQKIDFFGNRITVFRSDYIESFFKDIFEPEIEKNNTKEYKSDSNINDDDTLRKENTQIVFDGEIQKFIIEFFDSIPKRWNGINCYKEMIEENYKSKFQSEWVGFFLEHKFEKYLMGENLSKTIKFVQDKRNGGVDLDLYFPTISAYGDLKAHSDTSRGIQGNDWKTIQKILDEPQMSNHIYYIVCEHSTEKDNNYNFEVTRYWNMIQGKPDLMSYSKRMKHNVKLNRMYILDINNENKQYLSMFKQGVNSNGKLREPKIMIEHDKIEHFLICEREIKD